MLSDNEKRLLRTPTSMSAQTRSYTRHHLAKKITKTAEDLAFMLEMGYDLSEIINTLIGAADEQINGKARILQKIIQLQQQLKNLESEKVEKFDEIISNDSNLQEDDLDWDT
jgi:hypothetical protein